MLFCFLFFSCSNSGTGTVTFEIFGKFTYSDDIQVFYNNSFFTSYSENKSVLNNVTGSDEFQNLRFTLPDGYLPTRFRIDLGDNKQQYEIFISEIRICYNDKCEIFYYSDLLSYFEFNQKVKFNKKTGKITLIKFTDEIYDPFFISKNITPILNRLKN